MTSPRPTPMELAPLGDQAITVTLGTAIDEDTHRRVRAACARLAEQAIAGVREIVPAFASVTIHYDPARVALPPRDAPRADSSSPYARLAATLRAALRDLSADALPSARTVEIPVCYGGAFGPDLEEVARAHDLSPADVVALHAGADYLVYMIGFLPGFAYLGGLPARIATPRRRVPRTTVPAGSVGIGGQQTGAYPMPSPGGWNLIGRTPVRLFDATLEPPTRLRMGDHVRFTPISTDEFARLAATS